LRLLHDGINPTKTNELFCDKNELKTTIGNKEFGHNARRAMSRFNLVGSSLISAQFVWQTSVAPAVHYQDTPQEA
jgi:hypothetical protein